ncbi:MAG: hypothetical protein M0P17_08960 [Methanoculleus sp.]|nr:hypothetical protein [Methanoculleus sp.]
MFEKVELYAKHFEEVLNVLSAMMWPSDDASINKPNISVETKFLQIVLLFEDGFTSIPFRELVVITELFIIVLFDVTPDRQMPPSVMAFESTIRLEYLPSLSMMLPLIPRPDIVTSLAWTVNAYAF